MPDEFFFPFECTRNHFFISATSSSCTFEQHTLINYEIAEPLALVDDGVTPFPCIAECDHALHGGGVHAPKQIIALGKPTAETCWFYSWPEQRALCFAWHLQRYKHTRACERRARGERAAGVGVGALSLLPRSRHSSHKRPPGSLSWTEAIRELMICATVDSLQTRFTSF